MLAPTFLLSCLLTFLLPYLEVDIVVLFSSEPVRSFTVLHHTMLILCGASPTRDTGVMNKGLSKVRS